jgi:hypothetical protein
MSVVRTAQEPDALRFGCFREYLHAFALASLDIIFLALFKLDRLGVDREVYMPIRRVKAFLYKERDNLQGCVPFGVDNRYVEMGCGSLEGQLDRAFPAHHPRLRR